MIQFGRSVTDRVISLLHAPARRIFRLKRRISLLVSNSAETGTERIVHGTYQSPILIQHKSAVHGVRRLEITLWNFA